MPHNNDGEGGERRIRDLLGLVKFCLETTSNEDATGQTSSEIEPMDPDRRAWLQKAINSMTVDTTRQLLENLAIVKETTHQLQKNPTYDVAVQKTCDALGILTDLCEEIDYAVDFAKLDGFTIFKPLIGCTHEEMIVKACELIAALAQNNPVCQAMAVKIRLLEKLVDFVHIKEDLSQVKARSYALYAISSIVRSNTEVRKHFESQLEGLSVLLHLLCYQPLDKLLLESRQRSKEDGTVSSVYWWRKLRIRSVFLFRTLCAESEDSSNYFFEKQAIKQLSDQLSKCNDNEIREYLLSGLKAFIDSLSADKQKQALKLVPNLREIVTNIQKMTQESTLQNSGDEEYDLTETTTTCQELLELIDRLGSA